MAKQIYISGSSLLVKDTITLGIEFSNPADECWYDEGYLASGIINLTHNENTSHRYDVGDVVDEQGVVFTIESFRDFVERNLSLTNGESTSIGFIDYNDSSTSASPVNLVADTWTDVPNDGLGAFTNKNYTPQGVTELMDTSNGYLDFSQLSLGNSVQLRLDFKVNPNINNSTLECRYVLGSGVGEYALTVFEKRLDRGSGKNYDSDKGSFLIYMGDDNTRLNAGKLQIKLSSTGTLINAGVAIQISK